MQPDLTGVSRCPRFVWVIQCFRCRWQVWVLCGEGGRGRFIGGLRSKPLNKCHGDRYRSPGCCCSIASYSSKSSAGIVPLRLSGPWSIQTCGACPGIYWRLKSLGPYILLSAVVSILLFFGVSANVLKHVFLEVGSIPPRDSNNYKAPPGLFTRTDLYLCPDSSAGTRACPRPCQYRYPTLFVPPHNPSSTFSTTPGIAPQC